VNRTKSIGSVRMTFSTSPWRQPCDEVMPM
jgi:hypothetical protein